MLFIYGRRKPLMFHFGGLGQRRGGATGQPLVLAVDAGHWVMVEKPEQINQAVAKWLPAGDGSR